MAKTSEDNFQSRFGTERKRPSSRRSADRRIPASAKPLGRPLSGRPGMLLIHYRHIMEKIVTPGDLQCRRRPFRRKRACRPGRITRRSARMACAARLVEKLRTPCGGKGCGSNSTIWGRTRFSARSRRPFSARAATEAARSGWRSTSCHGTSSISASFLDRHIGGVWARESRTEEGGRRREGLARMGAGRAVLGPTARRQ